MKKSTPVILIALAAIISIFIVGQSEARSLKFQETYTRGPGKIVAGKTSLSSRTFKVKAHSKNLAPKPEKRFKRKTRKRNCCRTQLRVNDNLIWGAPDHSQDASAGGGKAKTRSEDGTDPSTLRDRMPIRGM
jgi:hypothetical protein